MNSSLSVTLVSSFVCALIVACGDDTETPDESPSPGEGTDGECETLVEGALPPETLTASSFSGDLTLSDDPERQVDYRVEETFSVGGVLSIQPGVVVEFATDAGLRFTSSTSRVDIRGDACEPVVLRGVNGVEGEWRGLFIDNDREPAPANVIEFTEIRHAGGAAFNSNGDLGAVILWSNNTLSLLNSTIAESGGHGLNLNYGGSTLTLARTTFVDNALDGIFGRPEYLAALDDESTFSGNTHAVGIIGGTVSTSASWSALTAAVYVYPESVLQLTAPVTISAGAEFAFDSQSGISIGGVGSSFSMEGTADNPVVLRGAAATPGAWRGIIIDNDGDENPSANLIEHATIQHAGGGAFNSNGDLGAIILWAENTLTLRSVTVESSADVGLNATYTGSTLTLEGINTFSNNTGAPVFLDPQLASAMRSVDSFSGNDEDFVVLSAGVVAGEQRWQALDIPYLVRSETGGDVRFLNDSSLTIDAGAEIVFEAGTGLESTGLVDINGAMGNPVTLRGAEATAGFWKGLYFEDPNDTSAVYVIDHANIRDAGGGAFNSNGDLGAIIPWADTSLSVTNTTFSNIAATCAINSRYFDDSTDTYTTTGSSTDGSATLLCDPNDV